MVESYEKKKARAIKSMEDIPSERQCTKCKLVKPIENFWKNTASLYGRLPKCNTCMGVYCYDYYRKDEERRQATIKKSTQSNRIRKYGVTSEEFESILISQNFCCAICNDLLNDSKFSLRGQLDHNHDTKKVRGILCGKCNTSIGNFKEDISILESAIAYLRKHNDNSC